MRSRAFGLLTVASLAGCSLLTDLSGLSNTTPLPEGGTGGGGEGGGGDGGDGGADGGGPDAEPPPGPPQWRMVSKDGPPRHSTAIAFDENRARMVLFGGWAAATGYHDTWEWDGTTWTQRTLPPGTDPPTRRGQRMVHDVARKTVFLFGGTRQAVADQWSWDGLRWTAVTSVNHPPSFQTTAMTYDTDRGVAVLFGGQHYLPSNPDPTGFNETWEWNGTDWSKRDPQTAPVARRGHVLVYDGARKRVLLYGGTGAPGGIKGDTWEYDGTNWKERQPITLPPSARGACGAFDPRRNLVVMFGGNDGSKNFSETWLWDGGDWSKGPAGPPALRSCAMAWDPVRRGIMLYGGAANGPNDGPASTATWYFE